MTVRPTTPASKEIFGHWAILMTVALGLALFWGIFSAAAKAKPSGRKPSGFSARFVPADDAAFDAARPPLMVQTLPDDLKAEPR